MNLSQLANEIREQRRNVGFDTYDITVKQLIDMVSEEQIHVSPEYQRHFVWDEERQSNLIESIFLGIPVPSLFMATNEDSSWEVIDGLQRITTLINFVRPSFKNPDKDVATKTLRISELSKLISLSGAHYSDLPQTIKLNFLTRPIRITVLNDLSDFQVRFDLFERLNTGGIVLHEQEIRNCVFIGKFNNFIKKCAEHKKFFALIRRTDKGGRGNMEELALKFFAYFEDRDSFTHSVKNFLNDYMSRKTKKFDNESDLHDLFENVVSTLTDALPGGIVRSNRPNTTPLALAEAVMVGVADVLHSGQTINKENLVAVLEDLELKKLMAGGTNTKPKLLRRIELIREAVTA